jgi:hypothetical protein
MEEYAAIVEIEIRTEAAMRATPTLWRRNSWNRRTASFQGQLGPSRSSKILSRTKENIYGKTKVLKEAFFSPVSAIIHS